MDDSKLAQQQELAKRQELYEKLWTQNEKEAVTDDEGTYVNLRNFNLNDHGLTQQDVNAPGNLSFNPAGKRSEGYFLQGGGGKFRLFRSR